MKRFLKVLLWVGAALLFIEVVRYIADLILECCGRHYISAASEDSAN